VHSLSSVHPKPRYSWGGERLAACTQRPPSTFRTATGSFPPKAHANTRHSTFKAYTSGRRTLWPPKSLRLARFAKRVAPLTCLGASGFCHLRNVWFSKLRKGPPRQFRSPTKIPARALTRDLLSSLSVHVTWRADRAASALNRRSDWRSWFLRLRRQDRPRASWARRPLPSWRDRWCSSAAACPRGWSGWTRGGETPPSACSTCRRARAPRSLRRLWCSCEGWRPEGINAQ